MFRASETTSEVSLHDRICFVKFVQEGTVCDFETDTVSRYNSLLVMDYEIDW